EELVALVDVGLSAVTWANPIEDPITEWGQLLAYMPLVLRRIEQSGPNAFLLPKPTLGRRNVRKPRAILGELASLRARSYPELREQARGSMRRDLERRGLLDLLALLSPEEPEQ